MVHAHATRLWRRLIGAIENKFDGLKAKYGPRRVVNTVILKFHLATGNSPELAKE